VRIPKRIAQEEREIISARTKAALAAAKAGGVRLDGRQADHRNVDPALGMAARIRASDEFAHGVGPVVAELCQAGIEHRRCDSNALLAAASRQILPARVTCFIGNTALGR
jgi:hypothetical protein